MFPNHSRAEIEVVELRFRDLRDEAARRRRAGEVPVTYRGRDWGVSRRQALTMLLAIGLLALALLRPWTGEQPVVAEGPSRAIVAPAADPER